MKRAYDITKRMQDLRYLDFGERDVPSGLRGGSLKAREGTGPNAIYYKLASFDARTGRFGIENANELVACRLARLLGVPHVEHRLLHALVTVEGEERETWVLRSKSFRLAGERKMPFSLFYHLRRERGETPLDLAERMGWRGQCEQMMAFDFLIGNAGRGMENVEVLGGAGGGLRLAPLFSHGHSLLLTCVRRGPTGRVLDPLRDVTAENCFGGTSLEENLRLTTIGEGNPPFVRPLSPSAREPLLRGLSGVLPEADLEAMWAVVWTRWERYARLCRI